MDNDDEQVMNSIWVISVFYGGAEMFTVGTGVSVGFNRIVTCFHVTEINERTEIRGRRPRDTRSYNLSIVYQRPNWDLVVLKLHEEPDFHFDYLRISDNQVLDVGDQLFHIGHPDSFVGHFLTGLVQYPCLEMDPDSFKDSDLKCRDHKPDFDIYRGYSIMGDIVNCDTPLDDPEDSEDSKDSEDSEDSEEELELIPVISGSALGGYNKPDFDLTRDLCPLLPVISCTGLGGATGGKGQGSSGGPLFREDGEIVGILTSFYKFTHALHVSVLKQFLREANEVEPEQSYPPTASR